MLFYTVSAALCYGLGYRKGETNGINSEKVKQAEYSAAQIESKEKLQKDYDALSLELAARDEAKKAETKIVVKKVIEYVQIPNRNVCEFDNDWMQLRTSILNNADPRGKPAD